MGDDFPSLADGVMIPHGIYDLKLNHGYIHLGSSHDTSQFACDCLRSWWLQDGLLLYPKATAILALCDGGGSNSSRTYLFKQDLQDLVNQLGIEIRIAHYPPYCSKFNPIEHRFFPHLTRACRGVIFKTRSLVQSLMQTAHTSTGLCTTVRLLDRVYATGRKVAADFVASIPSRFRFDDSLPQWNYRAIPDCF